MLCPSLIKYVGIEMWNKTCSIFIPAFKCMKPYLYKFFDMAVSNALKRSDLPLSYFTLSVITSKSCH